MLIQISSIFIAPPSRGHATRGRKRGSSYKTRGVPSKRGKRSTNSNDIGVLGTQDTQTSTQARFIEPAEKPDANMALKYTFGVNAWRQWVRTDAFIELLLVYCFFFSIRHIIFRS